MRHKCYEPAKWVSNTYWIYVVHNNNNNEEKMPNIVWNWNIVELVWCLFSIKFHFCNAIVFFPDILPTVLECRANTLTHKVFGHCCLVLLPLIRMLDYFCCVYSFYPTFLRMSRVIVCVFVHCKMPEVIFPNSRLICCYYMEHRRWQRQEMKLGQRKM